MTIKKGTVKKLCNKKPWPASATILMPPVYQDDSTPPVQNDLRQGSDRVVPPQWWGAATMDPAVIYAGPTSLPSGVGNKIFYAAVLQTIAIQYLGPRYYSPDPGVQDLYQDVLVWDCGPWSGVWDPAPPPIVSLVKTFANVVTPSDLFLEVAVTEIPRVYAVASSGHSRYISGGLPYTYNFSYFQVSGAPPATDFYP